MMSPECQRCQTPREGAARPSSKHHTRQVGPVVIQLIHKTTATVMTMTISLTWFFLRGIILAACNWLANFQYAHYKISRSKWAKIPLNLTSEGQKYPPEVRVRHETCSTICGTPVQAILDQKNLTRLAGGVREGQNNAFVHISHWNDPNVPYFDLPWPPLPTRSNFFGPKWLVHVSHI